MNENCVSVLEYILFIIYCDEICNISVHSTTILKRKRVIRNSIKKLIKNRLGTGICPVE